MKRAILSLLGSIALIAAAEASEGRTFFGLTFPQSIGGAEFNDVYDFESKQRGHGYSASYRRSDWGINVYIYDLGLASIPEGAESSAVLSQFERAKEDIVANSIYEKVEHGIEFSISAGDRKRFRCATYMVTIAEVDADSLLCITASQNKFIKFRISAKHTETSQGEISLFIKAWGEFLWPDL